MKKSFLFIAIAIIFYSQNSIAQQNVGIGTTTPDASAKLDVTSSNQGMLVPRMFTMQRITIPSPATGLLVFDTDSNSFWFYNGSSWNNLQANAAWQLTGNTGTDTAVNSIGTIDNIPLKFKINNERAGLLGRNGNIFWGVGSGSNSALATDNIAIGKGALKNNTKSETIAIGDSALHLNSSGDVNIAIGSHALQNNTNGGFNVAIGQSNLLAQTSGSGNTAIGASVLAKHKTGDANTALGTNALFYDTTGNENTAIGLYSLLNNLNGSNNTALGSQSLTVNTTGTNNLAIGYTANVLANNLNNASAIGAKARVDCSNCMVLGSVNGINGATSGVNVGIGITNPVANLDVAGNIQASGLGIVNSLKIVSGGQASDFLIKNDVAGTVGFRKGHTGIGLNYIMALQGVFPSQSPPFQGGETYIGEVILFSGNSAPFGWAICNGQMLPVMGNENLFAVISTTYGGNGVSNFALPDLRNWVPVGVGSNWTLGENSN